MLTPFLAFALLAGDPLPAPSIPVHLAVQRGRVALAPGEEGERLMAVGTHVLTGDQTLEVGPGSRVELRWVKGMSLLVDGPAEVRIPACREGDAPGCHLVTAARVEWEARRAGATLTLSQGWRLSLDRGAARIEAAGGDALDVRHHGGPALRIGTLVRRQPGSWPALLNPGSGVRLAPRPPFAIPQVPRQLD